MKMTTMHSNGDLIDHMLGKSYSFLYRYMSMSVDVPFRAYTQEFFEFFAATLSLYGHS